MLQQEKTRLLHFSDCPGCGDPYLKRFRSFADEWSLDRCSTCGFTFLNPQPTPDYLAELYNRPAYFAERIDNTPSEEKARARAKSLLPAIETLTHRAGRKGKLLEIGCGYGFLLGAAKLAGWEVRGVELSSHAAEFARKVFDIEIHNVGVEALAELNLGQFDAVIMLSVLEHVPQPLPVLQDIRKLLNRGALFWGVVPNVASFDRLWHGRLWSGWDLPYHLWHFSPQTIRAFLQKAGFGRIDVEPTFFNPWKHLKVGVKAGNLRADIRTWKASPNQSAPVEGRTNGNGSTPENSVWKRWVKTFCSERDMNVWAYND